MSVVVVATIRALPECREEVAAALQRLVVEAHSESGVERFALLAGTGDEFVIIEKWADQEAVEAHIAAPLSVELRDILRTKLREPPTHAYLAPVPVGLAHLGEI